jgi:DNA-binding PadR family transcriptional regulator
MADTPSPPDEPLTPTTFHVLLALSAGPLHGYGVMQRVEEDSGIQMGPGTVYGALNRLQTQGWIEDAKDDASDPRRGRRFALTASGRKALRSEARRLGRLTELAHSRTLLPEDPPSVAGDE